MTLASCPIDISGNSATGVDALAADEGSGSDADSGALGSIVTPS